MVCFVFVSLFHISLGLHLCLLLFSSYLFIALLWFQQHLIHSIVMGFRVFMAVCSVITLCLYLSFESIEWFNNRTFTSYLMHVNLLFVFSLCLLEKLIEVPISICYFLIFALANCATFANFNFLNTCMFFLYDIPAVPLNPSVVPVFLTQSTLTNAVEII